MGNRSETVWWSLFAVGGVIAAMLIPVVILLTGILVPAGLVTADGLFKLIQSPITRVVLVGLISLSLFHCAHRLLFTLADMGLKSVRGSLAIGLHTVAILGTVLAVILVLRV